MLAALEFALLAASPNYLEPSVCARARKSRDARFDGRFFVGVRSTGIYCRPICPVQPPKEKNVRYFPSAAAAAGKGFRPCLRCRPEVSPVWQGTEATVARALRCIAAGALDRGNVTELARQCGVGARHLRRLFEGHLGASPQAVAQTRRLHFAKQLIDHTDLPMSSVALGAGFGSVRRFNATVSATWGRPPRELRRDSRRGAKRHAGWCFKLPFRPPLDWQQLLTFYGRRALAGVEQIAGDCYRRSFRWREQVGCFSLRPLHSRRASDRHCLELRVELSEPGPLLEVVARVRRMFDLDADPGPIRAHLQRDPELARRLSQVAELRLPGGFGPFEICVRAILGQQIRVEHATALTARLVERCGQRVAVPVAGVRWFFPQPQDLRTTDLQGLGLSGAKRRSLVALAEALVEGRLELRPMLDLASFVRRLQQIPGIGPWTAHYVALRGLAEPDAFPASDLGLRKALGIETTAQLQKRAEAWRPWRAYAAILLWRSLAAGTALAKEDP